MLLRHAGADTPRMAHLCRRLAAVLTAASVLAAACVLVLAPASPARASATLLASLNAERAAVGVPPLRRVADLDAVAQAWSQEMARTGTLEHNPLLGTQVGNWRALGENVGYGSSEAQVNGAFVASPGHYKNIVNRSYDEVGLGIVWSGSRIWITEVFRQAVVPTPAAAPAISRAQAEAYVRAVYRDLLGREPEPAGLSGWASALVDGTPVQAVSASITSSAEYRSTLVRSAYGSYLGRSADWNGMMGWVAAMNSGFTIQDVEAGFIASPEFYAGSGSTPKGFVTRLYRTVIGRDPSASEVSYWVGRMQGGATRFQVAIGFLQSTEDLGARVDALYQLLLSRPVDAAGRASWVSALQRGMRVEVMVSGLVSSREYATST